MKVKRGEQVAEVIEWHMSAVGPIFIVEVDGKKKSWPGFVCEVVEDEKDELHSR